LGRIINYAVVDFKKIYYLCDLFLE
jgi:hypothetical protein